MGIQGLLMELRPVAKRATLQDLAGKRAAVDALCWFAAAGSWRARAVVSLTPGRRLHRGIYTCALELGQGRESDKFVTYCRARMVEFLRASISVIFVFDGDRLPAKAGTEKNRHDSREAARKRAFDHLAKGQRDAARKYFAKAVDVTPEMCAQFMKLLHELRVPFIVAPYEADSQLGYLYRAGIVDLVVTEDSDALVYGCGLVLYKFTLEGGGGDLIALPDVLTHPDSPFRGFTHDMFVDACVLMGCDYAPSLQGVGAKTAMRYARRHLCIDRVVEAWRHEMKRYIPPDYLESALKARATFLHQRVFDPVKGRLTTVTPLPPRLLPEDNPRLDFLGPYIPHEVARRVAAGEIHPTTKDPMPEHLRISSPSPARRGSQGGASGDDDRGLGRVPAADRMPKAVLARMRDRRIPTEAGVGPLPQRRTMAAFVTRQAGVKAPEEAQQAQGQTRTPAVRGGDHSRASHAPRAHVPRAAPPAQRSRFFGAAPPSHAAARATGSAPTASHTAAPGSTSTQAAVASSRFLQRRKAKTQAAAAAHGPHGMRTRPDPSAVGRWLQHPAAENVAPGGPSTSTSTPGDGGLGPLARFAHPSAQQQQQAQQQQPRQGLDLSRPQRFPSLGKRRSPATPRLHSHRVDEGRGSEQRSRTAVSRAADSTPQGAMMNDSFAQFEYRPAGDTPSTGAANAPQRGRDAPTKAFWRAAANARLRALSGVDAVSGGRCAPGGPADGGTPDQRAPRVRDASKPGRKRRPRVPASRTLDLGGPGEAASPSKRLRVEPL